MKTLNNNYLKFVICLFFLMASICHAQNEDTTPLIGNWLIDNTATMQATPQENMDQLNHFPEIKAQIMASYIGRTLSFYENRTFSKELSDGNAILFITANGYSQLQEFSILADGRLLLSLTEQGDARHLVPNQYFVKQ